MSVHPQKSREARAETGSVTPSPAAVSIPQPHNSLARGPCDLRGPQVAPCRDEGVTQPSRADANAIAFGILAALLCAALLGQLQAAGLTR